MRAATAGSPFLLAVVVTVAVHGSAIASAETASCELRGASAHLRLPAPVTVTGACGAFVIGRHGSVRRTSPDPLPVPEGASWWPYTGVWDKLVGGHLIVGRWQHRLWHSRGTFRVAYEVGVITVGPQALAFSYGNRTIHLYLAQLNGHEHQIVSGEYPVGWTRGGFYTRATHGGVLRLRSSTGALKETLARRVSSYAYDNASGSLYFVVKGELVRTVGGSERPIASLNRLGFSTRGYLQLQPLGRLIALEGSRRLVVLHSDGAPFASTRLPRGRARADGISSQLTAAPGGSVVAFTGTRGNTASGSNGAETVYLLRAGDRAAESIHRERVSFAVCERGASLAWHGRWLLYSASEGNTAVIDTQRPGRAIPLTRLVRQLPGLGGGEGNLDLTISWTGQPSGM